MKLLPVRTAPFFAAGIILCSDGGIMAVIMVAAAAVLAAVAFCMYRKAFPSAAALCAGMAAVTMFISFVCQPILSYSGTEQELSVIVSSKYDYGGYAMYYADTTLGGHGTSVSFYYGNDLLEGDVLTGRFSLSDRVRSTTAQRICMSAAIEELHSIQRPEHSIIRTMAEFRRNLAAKVAEISDGDTAALTQGLLFGDTSGFSAKLRHAAKASGVMHFTAVSGSHFVIIMSVILAMAGGHRRFRAVLSAFCIPLAVLFFGADPTVLRAGIMLFICNLGPLIARSTDTLNSLCVSVLIMTVFTPYVMLDIGFQMSVMGVFGVSVAGPQCCRMVRSLIPKAPKAVKLILDSFLSSVCAVICIAPISVGAFGGISLVGAFATVVLTPVFTAALALGVMFAFTGLPFMLLPLGLMIKAAYHVILFFGSDSRLWLVLDFDGAGLIALLCMLSLTLAVTAPDSFLHGGMCVFGAGSAAAVALSLIITGYQHRVIFVSDGSSGAAVVCDRHEATVFLAGEGAELESRLADCLLSSGIYRLHSVIAPDLTPQGAQSILLLHDIYPLGELVTTQECSDRLSVTDKDVRMIDVCGFTISCAKSGDTDASADAVMYTGYKLSCPSYGDVRYPLYVSSRQNLLPENGINIFDEKLIIELRKAGE